MRKIFCGLPRILTRIGSASSDEARALVAGLEAGTIEMYHLGWYVNLLNGLLDFVTLVTIRGTEAEVRTFATSMIPGDREIARNSIEWIGLFWDELRRGVFSRISTRDRRSQSIWQKQRSRHSDPRRRTARCARQLLPIIVSCLGRDGSFGAQSQFCTKLRCRRC